MVSKARSEETNSAHSRAPQDESQLYEET